MGRTRVSVLVVAVVWTLGAVLLAGCGARDAAASGGSSDGGRLSIGVSLPQKTSQNWVEAEGIFQTDCEQMEMDCSVHFANGGVSDQQRTISNLIQDGVRVLVIGAVDGSQLGTQLRQAKAAGITVIAYDRMLTNTTDVDYYVAYDSRDVGQLQAKSLIGGMRKFKGDPPWHVELFAGSPDDANSVSFFDGAMTVLQPYIDEGSVVIGSGQSTFTQVATQGWLSRNAQNRMSTLLGSTYGGDSSPDGVLSPNDALARAIITAVEQSGKELPVVTGLDAEDESVTWVVQGRQYSTISKDTRLLVHAALQLAQQVGDQGITSPDLDRAARQPTGEESKAGHEVATYLLTPQVVTADNAAEVFADDSHRLELVRAAQK